MDTYKLRAIRNKNIPPMSINTIIKAIVSLGTPDTSLFSQRALAIIGYDLFTFDLHESEKNSPLTGIWHSFFPKQRSLNSYRIRSCVPIA